jgi:hypothetical protein
MYDASFMFHYHVCAAQSEPLPLSLPFGLAENCRTLPNILKSAENCRKVPKEPYGTE